MTLTLSKSRDSFSQRDSRVFPHLLTHDTVTGRGCPEPVTPYMEKSDTSHLLTPACCAVGHVPGNQLDTWSAVRWSKCSYSKELNTGDPKDYLIIEL